MDDSEVLCSAAHNEQAYERVWDFCFSHLRRRLYRALDRRRRTWFDMKKNWRDKVFPFVHAAARKGCLMVMLKSVSLLDQQLMTEKKAPSERGGLAK